MKKFLLALACICTLALASCGSKSPEDQAIDLISSTTKQLEKAETSEEFIKILKDMKEKSEALDEKYPDLEDNLKVNEKAHAAVIEFSAALMKAAQTTGTDLSDIDL